MKQALGLVEVIGLTNAIVVADAMAKSANVEILDIENTKGQGFMTIKVVGDVGAVNAAVSAGKQIGVECGKLVSVKVIPRPSDFVAKVFCQKAEEKVVEENNETKVVEKNNEIKVVEKNNETKVVEKAEASESSVQIEITDDVAVDKKSDDKPKELLAEAKVEAVRAEKKNVETPEVKTVVEEKAVVKEKETAKPDTKAKSTRKKPTKK